MSRPELTAPPEIFYNDEEAKKYTFNSRIMAIQEQMCERALELLSLPEDQTCLLLDVGCGSGLSGMVLEEHEHHWIGVDISSSMLKIATERVTGDLLLSDMGQGVPFKAGTFDGAVSISALQWICNIDKSSHSLNKRLNAFFTSLFACLARGARAVFQFYPQSEQQISIITAAATRCGFMGGVVVDYPNSKKAKKFFLVLMTSGMVKLPKALGDGDAHRHKNKKEDKLRKCSKTWIFKKKERRLMKGLEVKRDSKYTGRKRSNRKF
ncbi:probable 18S rRNA (guanine-N(7))-methyltransferase [Copidosoma floridanum]|uniref:probable 18S rRNA (guanine-N(7))-methyltransferase n=1 Tax=Copidosoma floridanum TaxID=29053 RepID=UPI0006C95A56|nr:probable 18S rRNA (guanine-N(7))-methyltransferase [Copidosoma floridanum]